MTPDKPVTPTVGMTIRRSGAKLRALSKAHSPLHVLLWQAREAERALQLSATAQKTLFSDVATWASDENLAISDVCSNFAELSALATSAQVQLAQAYKSFRKDMAMVLEGEKRSDVARRKLQEAEVKRHRARRLVLQAQNRTQVTGMSLQTSGDYPQLQTQLAEAERHAERAHMSSCETKSESEAAKLVILRSTLAKLSQCQLNYAQQLQTIFNGGQELAHQIPDPPPPDELLSCIRYTGFESTRNVLGHVKSQVQILSTSPSQSSSGLNIRTPPRSSPAASSTSPSWATPSPSAPENPFLTSDTTDQPPPYITTFNSSGFQNGNWASPPQQQQNGNSFNSSRNMTTVSSNQAGNHLNGSYVVAGQRSGAGPSQGIIGDESGRRY